MGTPGGQDSQSCRPNFEFNYKSLEFRKFLKFSEKPLFWLGKSWKILSLLRNLLEFSQESLILSKTLSFFGLEFSKKNKNILKGSN